MARDFKFAVCHRKAKKKSLHYRNMDLDNPLKLVPLREEPNHMSLKITDNETSPNRSSRPTRHSSVPPSSSLQIKQYDDQPDNDDDDDEDDYLVRRVMARNSVVRARDSTSRGRILMSIDVDDDDDVGESRHHRSHFGRSSSAVSNSHRGDVA